MEEGEIQSGDEKSSHSLSLGLSSWLDIYPSEAHQLDSLMDEEEFSNTGMDFSALLNSLELNLH